MISFLTGVGYIGSDSGTQLSNFMSENANNYKNDYKIIIMVMIITVITTMIITKNSNLNSCNNNSSISLKHTCTLDICT